MANEEAIKCPECRTDIGGSSGISRYKHAIQCLHAPAIGRMELIDLYKNKEGENARRVRIIMGSEGS